MDTVLITQLDLSTRSRHVLQRMKIHTVAEFINTPMDSISNQRGIGQKTIDELLEMREQILKGIICYKDTETTYDDKNAPMSLSDEMIGQLSQYPISVLNLSTRSQNGVMRGGIYNIGQLVGLSDEGLSNLPNVGKQSIEEIKSKLEEWIDSNLALVCEADDDIVLPDDMIDLYNELALNMKGVALFTTKTLFKKIESAGLRKQIEVGEISDISKKEYLLLIERIEEFKKGIDRIISIWFSETTDYLENDEFIERIKREFSCEELQEAILEYCSGSILERIDDFFVLKRQPLEDYLRSIPDDGRIHMVLDRLDGASLQEVGDNNSLTRERVRQITAKIIKGFPYVKEDYYSHIFSYFWFNRESFYAVFPNADIRTFEYLSMRYKKGTIELSADEVSRYKGLFSSSVYKYIEDVEMQRMKRSLSRQKIAWRVLIKNSEGYFDRDTFKNAYDRFLSENNLDQKRYSVNINSLTNMFRSSSHVVFNREGEFRYYENDASIIWDKIDFRRYRDSVVSSELIFRDYIEWMEEYDIRNGYELFCLLKTTFQEKQETVLTDTEITFRRIPVMIIGQGDEQRQIIKLVKELSPIECGSLFEAYEERFGLRKESALANLGGYIEKFQSNGKYIIDLPKLSIDEQIKIQGILCEKTLWSIEELERVFAENCVSSGRDSLNATTLYDMGFSLNVGYAYSRKYGNVTECIEKSFFSKELVDLNEMSPEISKLSVFRNYIYQMRNSMDYLEISPKLYASRAFLKDKYGLTEQRIAEIQKIAAPFFIEKYFNGNSLWDRIKDDQNIIALQDNKWLCTSIIRQQDGVFSLPIANAIILSLQRDELSLSKICAWIVNREGKMTLDRLTERINEIFGSTLDKSKVAFKIKENGDERELLVDGVDDYLEQLISKTDTFDDDLFKEEFY